MLAITLCYAQKRIRGVTLGNHLNSIIPESLRALTRWPKSLRTLSTRLIWTQHNLVSAYPTHHRLSFLMSTWSCFEIKSLSLVVYKKNSAAVFCVFPTLFSRHKSFNSYFVIFFSDSFRLSTSLNERIIHINWIKQMILTLAGQSQRLSHMWTWKIPRVFKGIRIHDHCDDGAVLFPTELWSHSDVSRELMSPTNWPPHTWVVSSLSWLEHCTGIAEVMGSNPVEDTLNFFRCTYETIAEIVQQVWGSFF